MPGLIEPDADIEAGDSGGPLVNQSAEVTGIDTAAIPGSQSGNGGFSNGYGGFGSSGGGNGSAGGNGTPSPGAESSAQGYSIPIDTAVSIASRSRQATPRQPSTSARLCSSAS